MRRDAVAICSTVKRHAWPADQARIRHAFDRRDAIGIGLVAALACWMVVSAATGEGNAIFQLALLMSATATYVIGRMLGGDHAPRVAGLVVIVILSMVIVNGPAALAGGPLDPPLGYGNANGALYALGVAAAAIIARLSQRGWLRVVGAVIAIALLVLTFLTASKAATVLAVCIALVALTAHRLGRWVVLVAAALVLATIAITVVVGLAHDSAGLSAMAGVFTERRAQLWREALEITDANPVFGVAPGRFADASSTARSDPDASWAHSAYLQTAAELGIPGAILLIALVLFAFAAMYRSRRDLRLVVICVAATAAFTMHAAIDYVMHDPRLVVIAALFARDRDVERLSRCVSLR